MGDGPGRTGQAVHLEQHFHSLSLRGPGWTVGGSRQGPGGSQSPGGWIRPLALHLPGWPASLLSPAPLPASLCPSVHLLHCPPLLPSPPLPSGHPWEECGGPDAGHQVPFSPTLMAPTPGSVWAGWLVRTSLWLHAAQPGVHGGLRPVSAGGGHPGVPPREYAGSESKRLASTAGGGPGLRGEGSPAAPFTRPTIRSSGSRRAERRPSSLPSCMRHLPHWMGKVPGAVLCSPPQRTWGGDHSQVQNQDPLSLVPPMWPWAALSSRPPAGGLGARHKETDLAFSRT